MKNKIVSPDEAAAILRDGDTVSISGFVGIGTPDELIAAIERRFLASQRPQGLTLVFAAAPGDGKERGLNRLAHEGLVRRAVGGHWALVPKLSKLALDGRIEAYNLPLGCISQLYRDIAARRAGLLVARRPAHLRRSAAGRRQAERPHHRGPGPADGGRWRGVPVLQGLPDPRRADPRHHRRHRRQHHHGARGADLGRAAGGDGGQELARLRHRPGGADRRRRLARPAAGAGAGRAGGLRGAGASPRTTGRPTPPPTAPPSPASCGCRSTASRPCRSTRAR